jgi:hypothetical protein
MACLQQIDTVDNQIVQISIADLLTKMTEECDANVRRRRRDGSGLLQMQNN